MNWLISRPGASRWLLLGLLLIQVGCSSTTFLYNRLDTLIGWYLSDYVTLSREQRKDFDGRVNELLDWHRAEELPRYVVWLTAFDASLEDGLSESELDHLLDQVEAAADRLQERVLNLLLDFGTTLSAEQRLEFVQTLQSDQANLEEKYLNRSDEEYIGAIEKQFQKNLGRFLGSLSEAQKNTIRTGSETYSRLDFLWVEDRARWVAQLDALLRIDDPAWPEQARKIYQLRRANRGSDYEQAFAHNTDVSRQLVRAVINQRTPKQDRRLRREIHQYRADFEDLISRGEPLSREALGL